MFAKMSFEAKNVVPIIVRYSHNNEPLFLFQSQLGYDFGDSIRFGAATAAEDEPDVSKMSMDLHLFEVYTKGFMEAAPSLTEKEVEMLPMGALIMTLEVATRFMKDYLDGDLYFHTAYPEHNLVRARTQIALVKDMLTKMDEMKAIVARVAQQVRG